ncbi:MAG: ATP-dependent DNA helicase, partial [Dermatophilus congolensis]|nr:ATP-dependent DNA helicase [Dermatophilus congolensis]
MSATARHSAADIAEALKRPRPTPEQIHVIEHPLRSVLVVAGAGSGKTETMASRVVWLVANGLVAPEAVLGLTFTRKAAGELAERIGERLRAVAAAGLWSADTGTDTVLGGLVGPTVSTYNAYASRLVGEHGVRLGVEPDSTLLGEALAWQLADSCVATYDGPMDLVDRSPAAVTNAVLSLSGQMAEHLRDISDVREYLESVISDIDALPMAPGKRAVPPSVRELAARCREAGQLLPLVAAYRERKREAGALDFADQVEIAARLALGHPAVARAERRRFDVVLLDEFQDTSEAQMRLLHALFAAGSTGADAGAGTMSDAPAVPVMAVGDPHQSIYGWRGASATTLSSFPRLFGDTGEAPVLPLSTSWRNDESVLACANAIARPLSEKSPVRVERLVASPQAHVGEVNVGRWEHAEAEAEAVADWVAGHWWADASAQERSGRTAAVLCRRRSQFAGIIAALGARGLPVEVVGLGGLLSTPEVGDVTALLAAAADPARSDLLMRLLTGPVVALGARDLDVLGAWARSRGADARATSEATPLRLDDVPGLVEAVEDLPPHDWTDGLGRTLGTVARERLEWLAWAIRTMRDACSQPLPEVVATAERLLGLEVELLARPWATPGSARANLDAFEEAVESFAAASAHPTPQALLAYLDAAGEQERGLDMPAERTSRDAVTVLTVHAAKGLEWDVVAVPGMVEGGFPSNRSAYVSFVGPGDPVADGADDEPGDVEGRTQYEGGVWNIKRFTDKGWLTKPGALPYALRGDAAGLPWLDLRGLDTHEAADAIVAFTEQGGDLMLEEERRLAYVALTRARHALLVTSSVWETQKKPRVTSRFLLEIRDVLRHVGDDRAVVCWAPMPDSPEIENPLATTDEVIWPLSGSAGLDMLAENAAQVREARQRIEAEQGPDRGHLGHDDLTDDFDALLAEWRERNSRRRSEVVAVLPDHLSTSDLVRLQSDPVQFALQLRRPMPSAPAVAARAGSRFHAWIESRFGVTPLIVEPLDAPDDAADSADAADAAAVRGVGADAQDDAADAMAARWQANFLASEWADRLPMEVELSIETVIDGIAVRGRIDAVFATADGGYEIVDWKSGRRPPPELREARDLQLALYRAAFSSLRGVDPANVSAAFFYAGDGTTVRPDLPDRDELTRRVAAL